MHATTTFGAPTRTRHRSAWRSEVRLLSLVSRVPAWDGCAELLECSGQVPVPPTLDPLPVANPVGGDGSRTDRPARGLDRHERPSMGAGHRPAGEHLVVLSGEIVEREMQVRERKPEVVDRGDEG